MKRILFALIVSIFVQSALSCVATLYANDPLLSGIGLHNGTAATTWQEWQVYNAGDDLDYSYYKNNFTIAPEGGRLGAYVDLGTEQTIAAIYNINVPRGEVYISIHFDINQLVLIGPNNNFIPFNADQVQPLQQGAVSTNFQPIVGHIYLIKITDQYDPLYLRTVKLIVLDANENAVTIRWDVLEDSVPYSACFVTSSEPTPNTNNVVNPPTADDTKAPGWVAGTVATLFVLNGILIAGVTILFVRSRHHYASIN